MSAEGAKKPIGLKIAESEQILYAKQLIRSLENITYPLFIDLTDVDKWTTFWQPQMAKWMRFVFLATRKTQKNLFHLIIAT